MNYFDELQVKVISRRNEESVKKYPIKLLKMVDSKINTAKFIVNLIRDKKFNEISRLIDTSSNYKELNEVEFVKNMELYEIHFGKVKEEFVPLGFYMITSTSHEDILNISGKVKREILDHEFYVEMDTLLINNKVLMIDYTL